MEIKYVMSVSGKKFTFQIRKTKTSLNSETTFAKHANTGNFIIHP